MKSHFVEYAPRSHILVPRRIPLYVELYFLYVAQLLHEQSALENRKLTIFLGLPKHLRDLPSEWNTVLLQVEQAVYTGQREHLSVAGREELVADPATTELVRGVRLHGPMESFAKASAVVDYSVLNVEKLRRIPELDSVSGRFFHVAPLLVEFPLRLEPRKEITIRSMYGSPNRGRRGRIRSKLSEAGFEVANISNYTDYETAFKDAAILLNFRQVEHFSTPEELRILPALLRGVIVICEDTVWARQSVCADFLVFSSEKDLATTILEVQNNYLAVWAQVFESERFIEFVAKLRASNLRVAETILRVIASSQS